MIRPKPYCRIGLLRKRYENTARERLKPLSRSAVRLVKSNTVASICYYLPLLKTVLPYLPVSLQNTVRVAVAVGADRICSQTRDILS